MLSIKYIDIYMYIYMCIYIYICMRYFDSFLLWQVTDWKNLFSPANKTHAVFISMSFGVKKYSPLPRQGFCTRWRMIPDYRVSCGRGQRVYSTYDFALFSKYKTVWSNFNKDIGTFWWDRRRLCLGSQPPNARRSILLDEKPKLNIWYSTPTN